MQLMLDHMHQWEDVNVFLPDGVGRGGQQVQDRVLELVDYQVETEQQWLEQRLGLWSLVQIEEKFWLSMKHNNPVLFRVALETFGEISSSGFAERVFSTCKILLSTNRGTIDFDTFKDLVILRHNKNVKLNATDDEVTLQLMQQTVLTLKAAGNLSPAEEEMLVHLDRMLFEAAD